MYDQTAYLGPMKCVYWFSIMQRQIHSVDQVGTGGLGICLPPASMWATPFFIFLFVDLERVSLPTDTKRIITKKNDSEPTKACCALYMAMNGGRASKAHSTKPLLCCSPVMSDRIHTKHTDILTNENETGRSPNPYSRHAEYLTRRWLADNIGRTRAINLFIR